MGIVDLTLGSGWIGTWFLTLETDCIIGPLIEKVVGNFPAKYLQFEGETDIKPSEHSRF